MIHGVIKREGLVSTFDDDGDSRSHGHDDIEINELDNNENMNYNTDFQNTAIISLSIISRTKYNMDTSSQNLPNFHLCECFQDMSL